MYLILPKRGDQQNFPSWPGKKDLCVPTAPVATARLGFPKLAPSAPAVQAAGDAPATGSNTQGHPRARLGHRVTPEAGAGAS